MAIKDIFKVSRKTFIDPSAWLGYSEVKGSIQTTWDLMKRLFVIPEPARSESFQEAITRLNLSEEDIQERAKQYFSLAVVFLVLGILSFIFGFYLLFMERTFAGCLLGVAVAAMFGAQAFRYHFWYFQIKQRKLGCTFEEWKQSWVDRRPGSNT